jgi:protein involved in polysaccharide export with SLBB domain
LLSDYVSIGGSVYRKGRYAHSKDMTINDLLLKCGGVLSDAYLNRIELIRTHANSSTEFFSLDLTRGDMNFVLNQKDSIFIHSEWNLKSKKVVSISGYIARPGFYFLSDSTRVSDLIFSRGGLEDEKHRAQTYMKRADLIRYNEDGLTTRIIPISLEKIVAGDKSEDILLEDRDFLRIYGIGVMFTQPRVTITGYVRYEGLYPLSTDMTVEDLILKAHGFKEGAWRYKAVVFRLKEDRFASDSISQVFEVEIQKDFIETGKVSSRKFFLKDNDHVVIRKSPDYDNIRKVTVSGEVKFPGVYSLTNRDETLKDVIERAGGLTPEAFFEGVVFQRDSIRIVTDFKKAIISTDLKLIMKDKDDVHIPKRPGVVFVEGFVYSPQKIAYRSDWSLDDYVEAAGGPMKSLQYKVGEVVVYYPGGNAKVDGTFFSPEVKEGSKIVVERVEKEPDSKWREEVRSWLGILTSTITILLLVQAASSR